MALLDTSLSRLEKRCGFALAGIYGCRLLGLFMVLPVLALYTQSMPSATGLHIGLALGIYGIFQALLQIPFGIASDKYGRKPLIILGLFIFVIGSIICALSKQIEWFIVGRAIQGAGAIGGTINALAADLTRAHLRSKVMMIMGIGVGATFLLAMLLGPSLSIFIGIPGLFLVAAGFGLIGIILLLKAVPTPSKPIGTTSLLNWKSSKPVILNADCLRLDFSIFVLHATLTTSFVVIPLLLAQLDLSAKAVGMCYVPVLIVSFLINLPILSQAEKRGTLKKFLYFAIVLLGLSQLGLAWLPLNLLCSVLLLLGFFTAFVFLEASLPALITRIAPTELRGMATGIFSSAQFCGIFVGGLMGGLLYQNSSIATVLTTCAGISFIWLIIIRPLQVSATKKEGFA